MSTLLDLFDIAGVISAALSDALGTTFKDYEDAVLHEAARHAGATANVTRDLAGLAAASLRICGPARRHDRRRQCVVNVAVGTHAVVSEYGRVGIRAPNGCWAVERIERGNLRHRRGSYRNRVSPAEGTGWFESDRQHGKRCSPPA